MRNAPKAGRQGQSPMEVHFLDGMSNDMIFQAFKVSDMSEKVVTQWGKARAVAGFRAFSLLGSEISVFALVLRERGHGAGFVSILMVVGTISLVAMAPLAGWITDRFSTQQVIPFTSVLQGSLIFSLVFQHNMVAITFTIFISSSCGAIENPAFMALMPTLVSTEDYTKQSGFSQSIYALAGFLAPAIGGILVSQTGYKIPFLLDAITFLILGSAPFFLRVNRRGASLNPGEKIRATDGFKYIFSDAYLRSLAILISGFLFAAGTVSVANIFLLTNVLHASVFVYGLAGTSDAIGMIVGGLLLMKITIPDQAQTKVITFLLVSFSACILLLSATQRPYEVLILVFLFGISSSVLTSLVATIFIKSSPADMRGRIGSALNAFLNLGMIASLLITGPLLDWLGTRKVLAVAGVGALLLVALLSPATFKAKAVQRSS